MSMASVIGAVHRRMRGTSVGGPDKAKKLGGGEGEENL